MRALVCLVLLNACALSAAAKGPPPFEVSVRQSGNPGAASSERDERGHEVIHLQRKAFTLRFVLTGVDHVRVFPTEHLEDLSRDDLFCGGCGMADTRNNDDWGMLVAQGATAEDRMGFNYWHYRGPDDHRCDIEPKPSKARCWRTVYRLGDMKVSDYEGDVLYVVISAGGPMDPKTYESPEIYRKVLKLVFAARPAAEGSLTKKSKKKPTKEPTKEPASPGR